MQSEQVNIEWMKDIRQKSTKPKSPDVDAFNRISPGAKAFLLLSKHKKAIRCKSEPSCQTEAMTQLILFLLQQLSSQMAIVDGDLQVCASYRVRVKSLKTIEMHERLKSEYVGVAKRYPPMRRFLRLLLYHLSTYLGGWKLFHMEKRFLQSDVVENGG